MIIEEIFYGVKCNRCGENYNDGDDGQLHDSRADIEEYANDDGWLVLGRKHYCPNCYNMDDDTPKKDFPEHLEDLNKFIDHVVHAHREKDTGDDPDKYVVTFSMYGYKCLGEHHIDFIKSLLGKKLISMKQHVKMYGWSEYTIELTE